MKRIILSMTCLLSAIAMSAQTALKVTSVHLKDQTVATFNPLQEDSSRVVFTPEGDSLGIKIYSKGECTDYLYSQIEFVVFQGQGTHVEAGNVNRNSAADLAKNKEGWRLEFPRFYQGDAPTFEVCHSTKQYGITYCLEWDGEKKSNRWTCYEMYSGNMQSNVKRSDDFREDTDIPSQYRTTLEQYRGSGFSRGHLCPSSDRLCSREQNSQTFFLSNMQPQIQVHNGGVWNDLEQRVRSWAGNCDTLYVVKAATIDQEDDIQGYTSSGLLIPENFYMALMAYNKKANKYEALGIWSPHYGGSTTTYVSIDELERRTGIDFFCNLPDEIEDAVEATANGSYWGVTISSKIPANKK